ncbi:hypothetical protein CJF32_00001005 [Rutstroemia sp. NJR-2017a WRK4]|nr:hypothetical protein CJF32_00001005 [Rutstroemia sp. NJR-2017a WRK4]
MLPGTWVSWNLGYTQVSVVGNLFRSPVCGREVLSFRSTLKSADDPQHHDYLLNSTSVGLSAPLLDSRAASANTAAKLDEEDLLGLKRITQITQEISLVDYMKKIYEELKSNDNIAQSRIFDDAKRELVHIRPTKVDKIKALNWGIETSESERELVYMRRMKIDYFKVLKEKLGAFESNPIRDTMTDKLKALKKELEALE